MADRVKSAREKEKQAISRHVSVGHCILLQQHLSTAAFYTVTNAFQRPTRPIQVNVSINQHTILNYVVGLL